MRTDDTTYIPPMSLSVHPFPNRADTSQVDSSSVQIPRAVLDSSAEKGSKRDICPAAVSATYLVPQWLVGAWKRSYMLRRDVAGKLTLRDEPMNVVYLQAPSGHFVDIRAHPRGEDDGVMAFGGLTSTSSPSPVIQHRLAQGAPIGPKSGPTVVSWHACLNFPNPAGETRELWAALDCDDPPKSSDCGLFYRVAEDPFPTPDGACVTASDGEELWAEEALDGSYFELWVKQKRPVSFDTSIVLRSVSGNALFVLTDGRFAISADGRNAPKADDMATSNFCLYAAGQLIAGKGLVVTSVAAGNGVLQGNIVDLGSLCACL